MSMEIVKASESTRELAQLEKPLQIKDLLEQVNLIQEILSKVMIQDVHYGVIPGTSGKPSLLKPGAEKICFTFRLAPEYDVTERDLEGNHREYKVVCTLRTPNGRSVGQGLGACSTMESKYRWRNAERICPKCGNSTIFKSKKDGGWFCWAKKGGCGRQFVEDDPEIVGQTGGKVENDNPADQYNTALKMAKKRAHVDAALTATAASDIFTQDVEEISENLKAAKGEEVTAEQVVSKQADDYEGRHGKGGNEPLPSAPADWREVGVAAEGPSKGTALGELDEEKLQFLFSNWIPARLGKAASKPITEAERAMIDGVMEWKRQQGKLGINVPHPMTSQEFQQEREKQQAEATDDEIAF